MTATLFSPKPPLAERLRPKRLADFVGQRHLLGPGKLLERLLKRRLPSLILWGPPGCGKTTLARLLTREVKADFVPVSAVEAGLNELREALKRASQNARLGRRTILFIDEIHRFNRAQQDFLLPFVEAGKITLIGATTENPSFRVVAPLLSRVLVLRLEPLKAEEIGLLLERALREGFGGLKIEAEEGVLEALATAAQGDARVALNFLENLVEAAEEKDGVRKLTLDLLKELGLTKPLTYDQAGEEHYNLLSAFHKSLRGSDPDAALYWMVRMLEAGEDPLVIIRRLVAAAAEDVGLADPYALKIALAAKEAYEFLGSPEGELALAEAVIYVALAPKSNASYQALEAAREDVKRFGALPVPLHLRNPVTGLMRKMGYGKGYRYPHHFEGAFVKQAYLPEELKERRYYEPSSRGFEEELRQRLLKLWPERGQED